MEVKKKSLAIFGALIVVVALLAFYGRDLGGETMEEGVVVATVDGMEIFESDVQRVQGEIAIQTGQMADKNLILQGLIRENLVLREAEASGISMTFEEAEEELGVLASEKGLDLEEVESTIKSRGASYDDEVENFRKRVLTDRLMKDRIPITEVSSEEAREYYDKNKEVLFTGEIIAPYDQVEAQLKQGISQTHYQQGIIDYVDNLRETASVEYFGDYVPEETGTNLKEIVRNDPHPGDEIL